MLDAGKTLFAAGVDAAALRELNLLTTKPFLYVFNADEAVLTDSRRVGEHRLVGVEHIQEGLGGQQVQLAQRGGIHPRGEQRLAGVEHLLGTQCRVVDRLARLVGARFLLQPARGPLQGLQICQDQLGLDDLNVGLGIDPSGDMSHVVVDEHPHHLTNGVAFADMSQELVTQPGSLGRPLDQAGDIHEGDRRGYDSLRSEKLSKLVQAGIGQGDDTFVRFDRRERVVGRDHVVSGQRVEKCRLADVGQAHDPQAQAHREPSLRRGGAAFGAIAGTVDVCQRSGRGRRYRQVTARFTPTSQVCRGGLPS
ncbi:GTP-binding protein [Mycobacterium tuberculosis]|nr:GTP-binding protein [Mycobacterium tuberculosis]